MGDVDPPAGDGDCDCLLPNSDNKPRRSGLADTDDTAAVPMGLDGVNREVTPTAAPTPTSRLVEPPP
jgi:hypothetical protein